VVYLLPKFAYLFGFSNFRLWAYLMKGYFRNTNFDIYCFSTFRFWPYQMKVISETLTLIFTIFQPFDFERTRWRLFQKHYLWYLLFFNLSTLSVPDEGYSRNTNFDIYCFSTFDIKVSVSGITFIWYAQGRKGEKQ
jgi:hypothetical protein